MSMHGESCTSNLEPREYLCVVALGAQGKHLVKALAPGHQPAEAPEGASAKIATADPLKFAIALHLKHADTRANVDKKIGEEILVSCTQQRMIGQAGIKHLHAISLYMTAIVQRMRFFEPACTPAQLLQRSLSWTGCKPMLK